MSISYSRGQNDRPEKSRFEGHKHLLSPPVDACTEISEEKRQSEDQESIHFDVGLDCRLRLCMTCGTRDLNTRTKSHLHKRYSRESGNFCLSFSRSAGEPTTKSHVREPALMFLL